MSRQDRRVLDVGAMLRFGLDSDQVDQALQESNLTESECTLTEATQAVKRYVIIHNLQIPRIDR